MEGTLQEITAAVDANDEARLLAALHSLATGFQNVDDTLAAAYMAQLRAAMQGGAVRRLACSQFILDLFPVQVSLKILTHTHACS